MNMKIKLKKKIKGIKNQKQTHTNQKLSFQKQKIKANKTTQLNK